MSDEEAGGVVGGGEGGVGEVRRDYAMDLWICKKIDEINELARTEITHKN